VLASNVGTRLADRRLVTATPDLAEPALVVDDFTIRRGQNYGTIWSPAAAGVVDQRERPSRYSEVFFGQVYFGYACLTSRDA
jgi:hypothetical protein